MLRVTRIEKPKATTLKLEGKLCGAWVEELRQCWSNLVEEKIPVEVDLEGLSFLDASGTTLLLQMERRGTLLLRGSAFVRCLLHPEPFRGKTDGQKSVKES
jgi:anti-anti-sigma regulatory factor